MIRTALKLFFFFREIERRDKEKNIQRERENGYTSAHAVLTLDCYTSLSDIKLIFVFRAGADVKCFIGLIMCRSTSRKQSCAGEQAREAASAVCT